MDGYAVKAIDTDGATRDTPVELRWSNRSSPGSVPRRAIEPGQCSGDRDRRAAAEGRRRGRDGRTVERDGSHVADLRAARPGQHIGRAGGDIVAGELALGEGTVLTPARIGVAAALGLTDLEVFARPRVAILSTGDEIVAPGGRLGPGQIFDANTSALAAAVAGHGGEPVVQPRTRDDRAALTGRSTTPCVKTSCCSAAAAPSASETSASRFSARSARCTSKACSSSRASRQSSRRSTASPCSAFPGTRSRASPTCISSSRQCCAAWRACRRRSSVLSRRGWPTRSAHRAAGTRCTRCGSKATWRCRCSRARRDHEPRAGGRVFRDSGRRGARRGGGSHRSRALLKADMAELKFGPTYYNSPVRS